MLRGLQKSWNARRGAAGKVETSNQSTTSSDGTSSLFALDDGAGAHAAGAHRGHRATDATMHVRGACINIYDDDSVRAREAAAAQRLEAQGALDPQSAAYQVRGGGVGGFSGGWALEGGPAVGRPAAGAQRVGEGSGWPYYANVTVPGQLGQMDSTRRHRPCARFKPPHARMLAHQCASARARTHPPTHAHM